MLVVDGKQVATDRHTDGSVILKCPILDGGDRTSIYWRYDGDEELTQLMMVVRHIRDVYGIERISLTIPYFPYARMDRTQSVSEVFTLKHFAWFINSLGFEKVYVFDPHSSVTPALLDHVVVHTIRELVKEAEEDIRRAENDLVPVYVYPDEGAMKKYSKLFNRSFGFGQKVRDWESHEILGLTVHVDADKIVGKPVLIIDDICSRGDTVLRMAKALKQAGAGNLYLCVSHCEKTVLDSELLRSGLIEMIYTTNSIQRQSHAKILPVDILENMVV